MPSFAYALPIKSGTEDIEKKLVEELHGSRAATFHEKRGEHGFSRIKVFRQRKPENMVVFYVEAPDLRGAHGKRDSDEHEFEAWLDKTIEDITGHHIRKLSAGGPPSELLLDWHPGKGVSRHHHD